MFAEEVPLPAYGRGYPLQKGYSTPLVFVVEVPLPADCLAEAEGEDDPEHLDGDDRHRDADHHVQVADDEVVHGLVATLK